MKYVLLLRGVNVGKSVQVPMKVLKSILEGMGLDTVTTYLNSGNALFESDKTKAELSILIDKALTETFKQKISFWVKTSLEIVNIEAAIPKKWNNNENEQTYVAYLYDDLDRENIISELPIKKEYVTIVYCKGAIIWNIKSEYYNKSQITKIAQYYGYGKMTTRNVNTARKLAELAKV